MHDLTHGANERTLHVRGRVDRAAPLPLRGLGVVAAAGAALLVPLAWAALVAGVAWGCAAVLLSSAPVPAVVGGAAVALLVLAATLRPVLGPPVPRAGRLALGPREAPGFRRFLTEVAVALRIRPPRLLAVDAGVGVSVEGGRLIVGLGLLASVDRQTLAALVGAELARTSDRSLPGRAAALTEQVHEWLARAVDGRDRWAPTLERLRAGEGAWRLGRPMAWTDLVARGLLRGAQAALLGATGAARAQQARAADRRAAALVGADGLRAALRQLDRLYAVARAADRQQMSNAFERRRICGDLPRLVALEAAEPSPSVSGAAGPGAARVAQLRGVRVAGRATDDRSAASLFDGFGGLCQAATRARYAGWMRHATEPLQLVDPAAFRTDRRAATAEVDLLDDFLGGGRPASRRVLAATVAAPLGDDPTGELQRLRARCLTAGDDLDQARRDWLDSDFALQNVRQGAELAAMGVGFEPADYGVPDTDVRTLNAAVEGARQYRREAEMRLRATERQVTRRLGLAGALAFDPLRSRDLPGVARVRGRLPQLWALAQGLQAAAAPLAALHDAVMLLTVHSQQAGRDPALQSERRERAAEAWAGLWQLLPDAPCPLAPEVPLRDWLMGAQKLSPVDPLGVFNAYRRVVPRFDALAWRVLVEQAAIARAVEGALLDRRASTFEELPGIDLSTLGADAV